VAELIALGVDAAKVHKLVYDTYTENRLRLLGFALSNRLLVWDELHTAVIYLTREDLKKYKIPVSIFQDLLGTNRKDTYNVVKRALEGLLSKPIKIETVNSKGKRKFKIFNFISYGEYVEGEGNFIIKIESEFKPYLLGLKEFFSRIPIKYTYVLRSRYAIRLYELLKQYENTGFRIDYVSDLREMLGVEDNEYKVFSDFEKRVIKPAVKEINEKTDLEVSYIKKKTGRKITHIEFEIKSKNVKIGGNTKEVKSPSESLDIQGQEDVIWETEDLWRNTLKILEYKYNAKPEDIDVLREYTYARYKTDVEPKMMVIFTDIEVEKGKQRIRELLNKYWLQIKEILKIETVGSYKPAVHKSIVEKGKNMTI